MLYFTCAKEAVLDKTKLGLVGKVKIILKKNVLLFFRKGYKTVIGFGSNYVR